MKIDNSPFNAPPLRPAAASPQKMGEGTAHASEAVSLSAAANAMQASEKPPVNHARLQEIKDAIAQGRFKINPEAIADGLLDTARELVNSQRRA